MKQPLIVWLNAGLVAKPEARHNFQTRTLTGPTVEVFTTDPKRHAMNRELWNSFSFVQKHFLR